MLKGKTVLLGVTGGIACYKSAGLASALVKQGANVQVLMTRNATEFIGPHTFVFFDVIFTALPNSKLTFKKHTMQLHMPCLQESGF